MSIGTILNTFGCTCATKKYQEPHTRIDFLSSPQNLEKTRGLRSFAPALLKLSVENCIGDEICIRSEKIEQV